MKHFYFKVGLFGLLLMFCILFGVSLASGGVERIQGPLPPSSKETQEATVKPKAKVTALAAEVTPSPTKSVAKGKAAEEEEKAKTEAETKPDPVADHDNSLNHVGNKLGDLLQIVAHHGIKLFVSLFDAVLGKG
ncbi:hypothetical protein [Paenibacillus sedimenti]|uniref:DUF3679 domain-containing protein n=1 Tax=Paenibacillus sedimenti TaxID=2770274 RepID=A0A926KJU3_9BACL|nr:hypothetical protein [Paenibacillus sedimenti]MBD0379069.1 hypothetical protein [Paenibacillus sedimenti]